MLVNIYHPARRTLTFYFSTFLLILFFTLHLQAQQSNLIPNTETPLVNGTFSNLSVVSSQSGLIGKTDDFEDKENVIDDDLEARATWNYVLGGSAWLEVKDNDATGNEVYPAGSTAGFVIDNSSLDLMGSTTITTYLGGTEQESVSGSSLLGLEILGGKAEIFLRTTKDFDRIRIGFSSLGITGSIHIYYAYVEKYESGPDLDCNKNTSLSKPDFPASINYERTGIEGVNLGSVTDPQNVIDGNASTYATMSVNVGIINGAAKLSVMDNIDNYSAGHYVGFDISSDDLLSIGLLDKVKIKTYLGGSEQESYSGDQLIAGIGLISGSGRNVVGFVTTQSFDEVQLIIESGVVDLNLGTTRVYSVVIKEFCEGGDFVCNTDSPLSVPEYPVFIDKTSTGVLDVGLGESISDLDNILSPDRNEYATITRPAANVAQTVNITLKKELSKFNENTFAGFDMEFNGVIDLGILNSITLNLYDDDNLVAFANGSDLLTAGIPLLSGTGRGTMGVLAEADYNTIQLSIDYSILGVGVLSTIKIYGVVVKAFCEGASLECNTPSVLTNPSYPVYVNGQHTGITGGVNSGTINKPENAIDPGEEKAAQINFTAGVLSTASIGIADALTSYEAGTFAGIDISTNSLLTLSVLDNISLKLFKDGTEVQSVSPSSILINVNTALLTDSSRVVVGVMAEQEFNEIVLYVEQPVNIDIGYINVHGAIFEEMCAASITCYESYLLQYGEHPVIINHERTGVMGVADVGSEIRNPGNVLEPDNTLYGELTSVAGVLSSVSLSVLNIVQEYPVGTFAGFVVENQNGLIDLDLLNSLSINTYKDGILQESRSGSNLLNLTLIIELIGPGSNSQNIGFTTSKPFDEIQIVLGEFVSVGVLTTIRVYGAFIDTRSSIGGELFCMNTLPDFAVTYIGVPVDGNVSSNDNMPPNTTYGTPSTNPDNPSDATPSMNNDGTYSFVTEELGKYNFHVPVCPEEVTENCPTELLTITVIDSTAGKIPPIANNDYTAMMGDESSPSSISINVMLNDSPSHKDGSLDSLEIITTGSSEVKYDELSVGQNGEIIYKPKSGVYGVDSFRYSIAEIPGGLKDTATVIVLILPGNAPNTTIAHDHYATVEKGSNLSIDAANGLLASGSDPEGDTRTVTAKTDNIPGVGEIEISSDGSYAFTPESDYVGPAQFSYEVTDDGSPSATAYGTIHILVTPVLTPLPIYLSSFTTYSIECGKVKIDWESAAEFNVSHFEIQYSTDGKSFTTIKRHEASNSIRGDRYSITIDNIEKNGYFRLKSIDLDDTYTYSTVNAVAFKCDDADFSVYPNPAINQFTIDGLEAAEYVQIFDATGRLAYYQKNLKDNAVNIYTTHFSPGLYNVILIKTNGEVESTRLVISKP